MQLFSALFTTPAFDTIAGSSRGHFGKWRSRVRQLPEFANQLPAAVMAEEMLTEGEGQIRAMFTGAANPVLTAQNGVRLEKAFSGLDFMVSMDIYINETKRFADIILPPTFALEHDHYDISFNALAVRNNAKYSPPLFEKPEGAMHDWEIYTELGARLAERLNVPARPDVSPDQMLDAMLQSGPYGEKAGHSLKIDLETLKSYPNGLDLGPLQPTLPDRLQTDDKRIHCAPELFLNDLPRAAQALEAAKVSKPDRFQLIGRRHLFDANSWLHNFPRLLKGKNRCVLLVHPEDARELEIETGQTVCLSSSVGRVEVPVKVSDEIMRGVVSLPHGWGHHRTGVRLSVAADHPGVSMNDLIDDSMIDSLSGNAVINGIPVDIKKPWAV